MKSGVVVETRTVRGKDYEVVVLTTGGAVAEIWPALGGNCVRWATERAFG